MALAITDIAILKGEGVNPPEYWHKIDVDLNEGSGGSWLYLAYFRDPKKQDNPSMWLTGLKILKNDEAPASGWKKLDTDLNEGTRKHDEREYLAYQIGGDDQPIVGLAIAHKRNEGPPGYYVIDRDLNEHAGGSDLFLAYLRGGTATLTVDSVTCAWPSSGVGLTAKAAGEDLTKALSAATEAGVDAAAGEFVGPHAIALAAGAAAVKEILAGKAVRTGASEISTGIGQISADDFYLRANGARVWPFNKKGCVPMKGGSTVYPDLVLKFDKTIQLTIMELDKLGWFINTTAVHDELGDYTFKPGVDKSDCFLYFNNKEHSVYFVDVTIHEAPAAATPADVSTEASKTASA